MSGTTITTAQMIDYGFACIGTALFCVWAVAVTWMNLWGKKKSEK